MKNEFFGLLFHIRDYLHLKHIETTSYPIHIALEDAYHKVLKLTDELIEGTIGIEGYGDIIVPSTSSKTELPSFLQATYDILKAHRKEFKENWQLAILDEFEKTIAILIYKVKYLK